jgi:hypothetical protein
MSNLKTAALRAIAAWDKGTPVDEFDGFMEALADAVTEETNERLQIAAMAMQGLLSAGNQHEGPWGLAQASLAIADALIEKHDE